MKYLSIFLSILVLLVGCENDIKVFKESNLISNQTTRLDTLFEKNPLFLSFQWNEMPPLEGRKRAEFVGYYDADKLISLSLELIMPHPDSLLSIHPEQQIRVRKSMVKMGYTGDSLLVVFPVNGEQIINEPVTDINKIIKPDSLFDEIIKAGRTDILAIFQKNYSVSDRYLFKNLKLAATGKQSKLFEQLLGFRNAPNIIKRNVKLFYSLFMQYDTDLTTMGILNAKFGYTFDSFSRAEVHNFFRLAVTSLNLKMADLLFKIHRYPDVNTNEFKSIYSIAIQKNSLYLVKKFYTADPDIENYLIDHAKIINGIFGKSTGEADISAFGLAAYYGNMEIIKFFYAKNPSRMNMNKALACAVYNKKINVAEFLLKKRANPEVYFPETSAYHYAKETYKENSAIYKLLDEYVRNN